MNNHIYEHEFSFTQEQISQFATLTGDFNPLHLDTEYAAQTPFKKPIAHGMLSAGMISKVLGTIFPGEGSIYLKQQLEFLRPIYPNQSYKAIIKLIEVDESRHIGTLETTIIDANTQKKAVQGTASVMHKEKF